MQSFNKYKERGAYHWDAVSKSLKKLHLFTLARYQAALHMGAITGSEKSIDYGCGDGAFIGFALSKYPSCSIIGIEPEPVGRALALDKLKSSNVQIHASTSELNSNSYDLIFCLEVIEHVENPRSLLEDISRLLKPGGRLIISTPIRLTERPWDSEHKVEFFPVEFNDLISAHFVVKEHSFCSSVAALGMYMLSLRWPIRLHVGIYFFNSLYLVSGWNLFSSFNSLPRFWMTQTIAAVKR